MMPPSQILLYSAIMSFVNANIEYIPHPSYYEDGPTLHYNQQDLNDRTVTTNWSTDVPFWPHYPSRTVQVLDGNWYFGMFIAQF